MEPHVQYATAKDGVSIAYWTLGEGPPFVHMTLGAAGHIQLEWQSLAWRQWYEQLAARSRLIRFDRRGTGLSQRDLPAYSLDSLVLDLEAVVERLDLEPFILFAPWIHAGPIAITYAARHPQALSHLVLWCTHARGADLAQDPKIQALRALVGGDWETHTETMGAMLTGWAGGREARELAAFMRESISQEDVRRLPGAMLEFDATGFLPRLTTRTLVLQRRGVPLPSVKTATWLAGQIPGATLVILDGMDNAPFLGDVEAVLEAIDEFVGPRDRAPAGARLSMAPGAFRTILFTDIEGSTALTQRLGDAGAQEVLRTHNSIVREALRSSAGREIKHTGDGIMASFTSASHALACAVGIQRAVTAQAETRLRVRIGLNAGEPLAEEHDLFGTTVQLARRICDRAEGGEILVSNVVRELVSGKGFLFADTGEVALKGFEDPVRLYEVRWREDGE